MKFLRFAFLAASFALLSGCQAPHYWAHFTGELVISDGPVPAPSINPTIVDTFIKKALVP